MHTLTLQRATRKIGVNQTPREYLDFFVSGRSLKTILNIQDSDYFTPFEWSSSHDHKKHFLNVFRLNERSELATGRVMIYVCAECGDIDCGAITAVIKDCGESMVWSEFGYETDYAGLTEKYLQIEQIKFERSSYFSAFAKIV